MDYRLVDHYFEAQGWKRYYMRYRGTKWVKDEKEVVRGMHGFKLNGKNVDEDEIAKLLGISQRERDMYDALKQKGYTCKMALAFLDGIRWADEHPPNAPEACETRGA